MNGTIIVGHTRMTKIARFLGEEGAKIVAINARGEQFTIPASLRDDAEEGDHVILIGKEYHEQAIDPATGQKMFDGEGKVIVDKNRPFTREDVVLVGDYDTVAKAFYEDEIIAAAKGDFIKEQVVSFKTARKAPRPAVVKDNAEPANVGG